VLNQEPHVDGPVQRIEDEVKVNPSAQFTANNSASQCCIRFATAGEQEALAESADQPGIALTSGQNRGNDAPSGAAKDLDQLAHLPVDIGGDRTGVGKVQPVDCTAGERIGNQCRFVWPPAINGGFADSGAICNRFYGEIGEAGFGQEFERCAQDGDARLFAARTPGRPLSTSIQAWRSGVLFAHVSNGTI